MLTSRRQFNDRHELYETYLEPRNDEIPLVKASDLFKHTGTSDYPPKLILVVGRPGIGKTTMTKKIFNEWKQGNSEFLHGKIVILIQLRHFNKRETNLRIMLKHAQGLNMTSTDCDYIYEYICLMPNDVIFIFDGLDELKYHENSFAAVDDPGLKANILVIFKKLAEGRLLHGATVLTTSRPTAEDFYKELQFDQKVEIVGFHKEQIKSFVEKFSRNDQADKSIKLWELIEQSPEYLSLCYIPANCEIICKTL